MKCPLCGYQFREEDSKAACKECPLAGACHLVRCPTCGYDMPLEPRLIKSLKAWRRGNGAGGKSRRVLGDSVDSH